MLGFRGLCLFAASGDNKLRSCDTLQLLVVTRLMLFPPATSHFAVARPVLFPLADSPFAVAGLVLFPPATSQFAVARPAST